MKKTEKVFIIAELGTSHGGSLSKAKDMICAAKEAGADCVKFQIVYADEILHPKTGIVPLPGGDTPLYDVFKSLETPPEFFAEVKSYSESKGLSFLASPFGLRSAAELRALSPFAVKIASPELNYTQLVREIAAWHIPVFLSSGVSRLADIEAALGIFDEAGGRGNVTLFHCVTSYPAPLSACNLRLLSTLSAVFGVKTGLSDHSAEPCTAPCIAAALGASAIEKHFCLSREDGGLDDPIALSPPLFSDMVKHVRAIADYREEAGEDAALSRVHDEFGADIVNAALGDGVKRLATVEAANYGRTNRSIHALVDIAKGEALTPANLAVLRTEKKLRSGLPPSMLEDIICRRAAQFIPAGEGLRLADI